MRGLLCDVITLPTLSAEIYDLLVEKRPLPWLLSKLLYSTKFYAHPELLKSRVLVKVRATIKQQMIPAPSACGKDKKPKKDDVIYEGLTTFGAIICPN